MRPAKVLKSLDTHYLINPVKLKSCSISHKFGVTAVLLEQGINHLIYASISLDEYELQCKLNDPKGVCAIENRVLVWNSNEI